ncbi:hypothetical protein J437_LFUL010683 [Ladona fulva]|uniref:Uncharacterized protein n=1 Tax=Ladona fulva TaxID=123851 RepID=A0A8K0K8W2_LADFU|nr:hypothetical protein J437_LFUL010683 [Ladona fulva]
MIVDERDCYDTNGFEICCKPSCDLEKQRPCYKFDGECPFYKNGKPLSLSQADCTEPEDTPLNVTNTPLRKHSLPILCC